MANGSIDIAHSEIGFTVRHMVFARVRGNFTAWTATASYDPADPTKASFQVDIDVASIDTREAKRDEHLRSADFFDAAKFPKMTFRSKRVEAAGKDHFKLVGDLTIKDATHEVALDVQATGGGKDPWGNERKGFSAKGSLNRTAWGLKWNQALEAGGVLVSENVDLDIEVEVVLSK